MEQPSWEEASADNNDNINDNNDNINDNNDGASSSSASTHYPGVSISGGGKNRLVLRASTVAPGTAGFDDHPSGWSQYSPLSTLERQYDGLFEGLLMNPTSFPGEGRLNIFVKANANCCVTGGVETLWQYQRQSATTTTTTTTTTPKTYGDAASVSSSSVSLSTVPSSTPMHTNNNNNNNNTSLEDPFSFLQVPEEAPQADKGTASHSSSSSCSSSNSSSSRAAPRQIGQFFKRVAQSTAQSLERKVQHLAMRADQGRNPDYLVVGLYCMDYPYYNNHNNSSSTTTTTQQLLPPPPPVILLSMTESQPLPTEAQRLAGVRFQVPLVIPPRWAEETPSPSPEQQQQQQAVMIKLWIRSGASLLQQAKAAKHYLIGSATLPVAALKEAIYGTSQPTTSNSFATLTVPLQSPWVADGKLTLTLTGDRKFTLPSIGRGWSLTDPDRTAYHPRWRNQCGVPLFQYPLDQSYGWTWPPSPSACLVATERAVESAVVLPLAAAWTRRAAAAATISLRHAQSVMAHGGAAQPPHHLAGPGGERVGEYVDISLQIGSLTLLGASVPPGGQPIMTMAWQRPDSIFEVEILGPTPVPLNQASSSSSSSSSTAAQGAASFRPSTTVRIFPGPCRQAGRILPSVLQATAGQAPEATGFWLGSLRWHLVIPRSSSRSSLVMMGDPFTTGDEAPPMTAWMNLETFFAHCQKNANKSTPVMDLPVFDAAGQQVGAVTLLVQMALVPRPAGTAATTTTTTTTTTSSWMPSTGGLVDWVGLSDMMPDIQPHLDFDPATSSTPRTAEQERRRQQLATLGELIGASYLDQHVRAIRTSDVEILQEQAKQYYMGLQMAPPTTASSELANLPLPPPHLNRRPAAFRPSNSRPDVILSALPFNVHIATLSLDVLDPATANEEPRGTAFYNVTCGAQSDHARGFGNVFAVKSEGFGIPCPIGAVSGGLRRLEAKRKELADYLFNLQTTLVMSIANYFVEQRQNRRLAVSHVPARHPELQALRAKVVEAAHALHHLTWNCAVRRSNVFSQAIGVAVSTYLASLSDPNRWRTTWPEFWVRHGYLICFEGLLSAAGKELGMIEDASVGIDMLRHVGVILVADDGAPDANRVVVPGSPFLRWVQLSSSSSSSMTGMETEYQVEIGILPSYFNQNIPPALKNGARVRFHPVLFEVGVDIRQWSAHAGSNMKSSLSNNNTSNVQMPPSGGIVDDGDDDEAGVTDNDALVRLNYEGFQKLSAYAHAISPANSSMSTASQKTHPLLETLYQHIVSSAGKMNHEILVEAAALAQQLGGGGVVFCKSGKDRTAMHETYKQAQFLERFRAGVAGGGGGTHPSDSIHQITTLLRIYGTRLPICEKNAGQAKYAFNSLQVKFMPEDLRPPLNTLAGFLKPLEK